MNQDDYFTSEMNATVGKDDFGGEIENDFCVVKEVDDH